jgi:protein SCO1/2
MKVLATVLALTVAGTAPVLAATSRAQLDTVEAAPAPGASIPMSITFVDDAGTTRKLGVAVGGTPAVLIFDDYTCANMCGPILAFAAAGLEQSGLIPGKDFHLVVVGLDPKDGMEAARAMKISRLGTNSSLGQATAMLIGSEDAVRTATAAAGYHYVYDAEHDQFAHPAAAYVLTKDGRITRVLSGLGLSGADLRLALVEAGQGQVGTVLDQITLRCFGFDPALGIYTASVFRWLAIAGAGTTLLLFGFMAFGMRQRTQS